MKKLCILFVLGFMTLSFGAWAQLSINQSGNVGIDAAYPVSRFSIGADGSSDSKMYIKNSNTSNTQKCINVQQVLSVGTWSIGTASYIISGDSQAKATGFYSNSSKSTPYSQGRTFGLYAIA